MSGRITDLSRHPPPSNLSVEVCIVGSGPGGATAARELAAAGKSVVVLEEGRDYVGGQLTQRDGEMYDQLYMDRGGRSTSDLSISVLQGRVLGGGSVINASDVVPISDEVLLHWQNNHGLSDFTKENLEPYRKLALQDLRANRIRGDQVNKANRLLEKGTRRLGWKGEVMLHNRENCAGLGTCLIGCPVNAKQNARMVAVPESLAKGASYFTRARVVRIGQATRSMKTIEVRTLDAKGYHETGSFELRAKIVILAANAIGSSRLLQSSGIGNEHVGRNLMLQPQHPVVALFPRKLDGFKGIPQSYAVTQFEKMHSQHGLWGFRLEGIFGTPGIVASLMPYIGAKNQEVMSRYNQLAACLVLVPDRPSGTVRPGKSRRPVIHYVQRPDHQERMVAGIRAAARIYLEAGADQVIVPVQPPISVRTGKQLRAMSAPSFRPGSSPMLSAHQQGTVRFASDPKSGGANPDGQVYGTKDVYVFDSSGFPSSSSTHTMTPIITFSRFLSARLLTRL